MHLLRLLVVLAGLTITALFAARTNAGDAGDAGAEADPVRLRLYQPPRRPAVPAVRDGRWVGNPIDAFMLARLEAQGLAPSDRADKLRLLRRVTVDLTGLPP